MNKLKLIIKHEFRQITRGKVFILMTLLGPLLMGAFMILPTYFAQKGFETQQDTQIAIFSRDNALTSTLQKGLEEKQMKLLVVDGAAEGKVSVLNGDSIGFVVVNNDIQYYSTTGTDLQYSSIVERLINNHRHDQKLKELGISEKDSKWLNEELEIKSFKLDDNGEINDSSFETVLYLVMIMAMLIVMTSLLYGINAARSILTEKTSKTIEMLLSSTEPNTILLGKVMGTGLAGIIQFGVWFLMAYILMDFIVPLLEFDISMVDISGTQFLPIFILFVLGITQVIFVYASFGAVIETEQQLGQVQIPIQMILMIPIFVISSIIGSPNSMLAKVLSYIPITSPTVMTARILIDSPSFPMIILSIVILVGSLLLSLIFSSKVFRIGIINKGTSKNIADVVKLFFKSSV